MPGAVRPSRFDAGDLHTRLADVAQPRLQVAIETRSMSRSSRGGVAAGSASIDGVSFSTDARVSETSRR